MKQAPSQSEIDSMLASYQSGNYEVARDLALSITQEFPNHQFSWKVLGAVLKQAGKIDEALVANQNAVKLDPKDAEAHFNLAIIQKESGRLEETEASYRQAIILKPNFADAHFNLGNILKELGRLEQAEASYRQAIKVNPSFAEAHSNLGIALNDLGKLELAEASCRQAMALKPDYAETHINLGVTLQGLGRLEEAEASYRRAIELKPDLPEVHNKLGFILRELGRLEQAEASYKLAIEIRSDYTGAIVGLAKTYNEMGKRHDALLNFKKSHDLIRGNNPVDPFHKSFLTISKAKMDHDIEQFQYLADSGYEVEKFLALAKLYTDVSLEIDWAKEETLFELSNKHQKLLKETYNRPIKVIDAPVMEGGTLDGSLEREQITKDYFRHDHGLTYFDNFLTLSALNSLRKFLLGSTIWFDTKRGGYLGAYLDDGLACPLILQIADDLSNCLPGIFKNHKLKQLWAYKYDSRAHKGDNGLTGIKAHADAAAVNVNFWITPVAANLNPESGGLIVHNSPAPMEWDFKIFNSDEEKIKKHLEDNSSGYSIVPYNENRVVIFNSNLIHETDSFEFKEGYVNRRINVTMLFGLREGLI